MSYNITTPCCNKHCGPNVIRFNEDLGVVQCGECGNVFISTESRVVPESEPKPELVDYRNTPKTPKHCVESCCDSGSRPETIEIVFTIKEAEFIATVCLHASHLQELGRAIKAQILTHARYIKLRGF